MTIFYTAEYSRGLWRLLVGRRTLNHLLSIMDDSVHLLTFFVDTHTYTVVTFIYICIYLCHHMWQKMFYEYNFCS